ncbi:MAG TPA: DNA translocase FtsK [Balneola sp.]|jgi:DNA segregation ATPase FtsK/SpoIIIE, S-DNA-T family|nr:DNA translocase FtsK [Balneola sp.]MAO77424.1 DNA translocase FtsK [Balneola sp.]MBF65382.1 DNA translocase FtsK [Balneola sp.]HBZ38213.1 DNA translocase FtsK [Balneola sp.]|tara:strand:+ start:31490 stop:34033 length:2544 start_codon:yes stop_codon:yes gene_type:complete
MAKKKLNTAGNSKAGIDDNRKVEIIGVIIIALAILLGLSIVSYTPEDYQYATKLSFMDLFNKDASSRLVQNWLGPVGAYLSHFVVHQLFGYTSIILAVLIFFQGWHIFRRRNYKDLSWITILGVWSMILFSTVLGWMNFNLDFPADSVWSGAAGVAISKVLQNFTSSIGSGIILSLLAIVTLLLLWDRDLQKSIDNLKLWIENVQHKLEDARIARAEKKEIKAQEREERLAERRAEREAAKEEKVAKKEEKKSAKAETKKEVKEPEAPAPTIDDIVAKSQEEDLERIEKEKRASDDIDNRQKAALDKSSNLEEKEVLDEDSEELEVSVFKGEGDEEAGERDLDKINRDKAKEVPVIRYKFPTIDLLDTPSDDRTEVDLEEIRENKRIILDKLKRHRIEIVGINAIVGPTVTLYELEPAPDVKISKIESYSNDLKMAMASKGLRMLSPIPGKSAVGIEVPNSTREMVYIKQVINTKRFVETDMTLPVAFGKTIENEVFMIDLTKMPHLLMAGATGSGKSVGVNTIITCLLYKCDPENLKFVMIDPKKIELALYRNIQNHFLAMLPNADEPIVTDTSKALETLNSVCKEMDDRYDLLKMALVRDIKAYNKKFKEGELDEELGHRHLPYIVVIIDELADLMMTAGKQIEEPIARLAQLARAIGIHLVVATQRPSVNVITGTIKANFPARIAYQVASKVDSRTILDVGGADQLVGAGDMLFTNGAGMTRLQNAFVSTEEVERINSFIGQQAGYKEPFHLPIIQEDNVGIPDPLDDIDEMFQAAAKVVVLHQQGSVSLLQRKLKIGYNRAGRIIDQLFNAGIVGPYQGSTARDVLVQEEEELQEIFDGLENL